MTSPFGPLVLIANPRAGRGRVEAALPQVENVLRDQGLGYRIVRSTHPGHATQAARDALRNGERYLVAAGGDGTVHEVVNGMISGGLLVAPDAVLGVVAAGSGCDFVRSFGLPGDAAQAARHLAGDRVRPIDVGSVTVTAGGDGHDQVLRQHRRGWPGRRGGGPGGRARPVPRCRPVRQRLRAELPGLGRRLT